MLKEDSVVREIKFFIKNTKWLGHWVSYCWGYCFEKGSWKKIDSERFRNQKTCLGEGFCYLKTRLLGKESSFMWLT